MIITMIKVKNIIILYNTAFWYILMLRKYYSLVLGLDACTFRSEFHDYRHNTTYHTLHCHCVYKSLKTTARDTMPKNMYYTIIYNNI